MSALAYLSLGVDFYLSSVSVGWCSVCVHEPLPNCWSYTSYYPHPKHTDTHTHSHMWTHTRSTLIRQPPFHLLLSHIRWDLSLSLFLQTGALLHPWWGVCAQSESFLLCLCVCIRANTRTQHCTALSSISLVPKKVCMHIQALVLYLSEGKRERE